jgi:hypothetical protein
MRRLPLAVALLVPTVGPTQDSIVLTTALTADPPPFVAFYAHLFAGRAAQNLGQLDAARDHYAAARALFPGAQSARLGRSEVNVLRADVPAALAALRRTGPEEAPDPWWQYHLGAGRDADALLTALRSVSR